MAASADENADQSSQAENLGVKLRNARQAQDLSLDEVAAELRIEADNLRALEECRFDALGAPVFAKGYLKQYGARLGLDAQALANEFEQIAGRSRINIEPSRTIRLRDERQITIWIVAAAILVAVIAGLAYWWLGQVDGEAPALSGLVDDPAVITPDVQPAVVRETEPAVVRETQPAADPGAAPVTPPAAETVADDPAPSVASTAATTEPGAGTDAGAMLEIVFVEDSWTEISSLDGERLYYDLGRAGTRALLPVDRGLSLFFGNGAGIELRLNDEPLAIPATARRGDFAEFDLDPITE